MHGNGYNGVRGSAGRLHTWVASTPRQLWLQCHAMVPAGRLIWSAMRNISKRTDGASDCSARR